jgi:GR25 family glycosyltransferase involved in LPS biosynthesis
MVQQMGDLGIAFQVVQAVDGRDLDQDAFRDITTSGLAATWYSHVRAMERLLISSSQFGLILEDDSVLDPRINWAEALGQLPAVLELKGIDFLQLGFISSFYKPRLMPRSVFSGLQQLRYPSGKMKVAGHSLAYVLGNCRAGAHANVISKKAARLFIRYNNPAWLGPDGFYDCMAQSQRIIGGLEMARLTNTLAEQASRQRGAREVDSDNE